MKKVSFLPKGYVLLDDVDVYTNGNELVILGELPSDEVSIEEAYHDCDVMGCGSVSRYVIAYGKILFWDCDKWHHQEIKKCAES